MEEPANFETTSHLVGHLLREVESAVRAVLQPRTEAASPQTEGKTAHRVSIATVLKGLGVVETDPIAQLWLTLPGDDGLDRKAHRNALFQPRAVDQSFLEYWDRLETILDFVLERFEQRYLDYHRVLDELASIEAPTKADVDKLKQWAPNNIVAYSYFFEKISSPKWLEPLNQEGFFEYPAAPEVDNGSTQFPQWPQSKYLLRMAREDPCTVVDIILRIPTTENPIILTDFATAASEVPPNESARLVDKAKSWIETPYLDVLVLAEAIGRLAAHLAEGGLIDEALDLTRALMALRPPLAGPTRWILSLPSICPRNPKDVLVIGNTRRFFDSVCRSWYRPGQWTPCAYYVICFVMRWRSTGVQQKGQPSNRRFEKTYPPFGAPDWMRMRGVRTMTSRIH